ncbi:flagellar hook-length control protein FliK [Noviherbaspirillum massiliense]|uniref:flagellar hook-length control protein FliK n=1 Tax=Noviherbaspirillum massiliense TaxID=1465823 RepID=UPI0002FFF529|nr:flagellar hook-length control protein FliK [Noviherbaspirillum massiliense]
MQTSPILNPINALSSPAPAPKQPDSPASGPGFNQVLSREVAERRPAAEAAKAPAKEQAGNGAPKQAEAAKNPNSPAKSAENKTEQDGDKPEEDTEATASAPADMLALVASLGQVAAVPTEARAQGAKADDAAVIATDKDGRASRASLAQLSQSIEGTAASAKTATDGEAGFGAAMDQAAKKMPADALQPGELSAAVKRSVGELAAKTQEQTIATQPASLTAAAQPLAPAALNAAQAAGAHASDRLTPPVGSPAWDQALGQKVVWMVAGEQQSASLTLNPPDLGPLQVVLNVSNSQANATFIAAQPEVRQALEAALPKLRDMLGEAGIQLGQASVNAGTPNQHGSQGEQASQGARRHETAGAGGVGGVDAPLRTARVRPASGGVGMVDTFV